MSSPFELAGAAREPSPFASLHTTRIVTGLYTNRNAMRDAATTEAQEKSYGGRRDSIWDGFNCEISPRLTLRRRPGTSVYNDKTFNRINRFYSFNTFTLTDEVIHVLADCPEAVYDISNNQKTLVWTKATTNPTYFLGVGNTLYFTNGAENKQWVYGKGVFNWGGPGPVSKPVVNQQPRNNPYSVWKPLTGFASWIPYVGSSAYFNAILIRDTNANVQRWGKVNAVDGEAAGIQQTGLAEPAWLGVGQVTLDGTAQWTNLGDGAWKPNFGYGLGDVVLTLSSAGVLSFYVSVRAGQSSATQPTLWPAIGGGQVSDGASLIWQNYGPNMDWSQYGEYQTPHDLSTGSKIVDINGYLQTVARSGRSLSIAPPWQTATGAFTSDGTYLQWANRGPFNVAGTAPIYYGYAFKNSVTQDLTDMSPRSDPITLTQGNEVALSGNGPTDAQYDIVVIYSTLEGGSTFGEIAEIPAPPSGQQWNYEDKTPGNPVNVNLFIQAQINGEGTPLPIGATALEYHLGRIFAAVGNVVYASVGPDAAASGSSGNSGFDTTFTCQSKITRFWVNSIGIAVFTVRDSYMILGSGTKDEPLYMIRWVENIPLLSYDCLTAHKTNVVLFTGQRMVLQLDPGAGIVEPSFPIANNVDDFDPASSYLTFHTQRSGENALYLSDGLGAWYRMSPNSAPETGINWSTYAELTPVALQTTSGGQGTASCVQSVEITPGVFRLLYGPGNSGGKVLYRDLDANTDAGYPYPAWTVFGSFTLASPGQLAGLAFISLDSAPVGTPTKLSVLLGEISGQYYSGKFEPLRRTRQEPPDLPPSKSLYSDRFHMMQNQQPIYCRHMQMRVDWPAEDAANELYGFSLYGQLLEEYR